MTDHVKEALAWTAPDKDGGTTMRVASVTQDICLLLLFLTKVKLKKPV